MTYKPTSTLTLHVCEIVRVNKNLSIYGPTISFMCIYGMCLCVHACVCLCSPVRAHVKPREWLWFFLILHLMFSSLSKPGAGGLTLSATLAG